MPKQQKKTHSPHVIRGKTWTLLLTLTAKQSSFPLNFLSQGKISRIFYVSVRPGNRMKNQTYWKNIVDTTQAQKHTRMDVIRKS